MQQVNGCTPGKGPRLIFSALDASAAKDIEPAFAAAGHLVISNAKTARMVPDVPLVIPEINGDHLALIPRQRRDRGWSGAIVTNPNCSTIVIAMALAPLRQFGLEKVMVTTLQAVSGAGYPGVASLDILGNIIPAISGEEEKIESETQKILGSYADERVTAHPVVVSAQTTRVAVIDGHTVSISAALSAKPSLDDIREALRSFRGKSQALALPSAPELPIDLTDAPDSSAAAARCPERQRYDGDGRPRAAMPGPRHQARRTGSQHHSRRRRRRGAERRAAARRGLARLMAPSSRPVVVMKFGGTSVADAEAIGRVLGIARASLEEVGTPPIVVVSAMSRMTDRAARPGVRGASRQSQRRGCRRGGAARAPPRHRRNADLG